MKNHLKLTVAAAALVAMLGSTAPALATTTDDGGIRTTKLDAADEVVGRAASGLIVPQTKSVCVSVDETIRYVHRHSFWNFW